MARIDNVYIAYYFLKYRYGYQSKYKGLSIVPMILFNNVKSFFLSKRDCNPNWQKMRIHMKMPNHDKVNLTDFSTSIYAQTYLDCDEQNAILF